MPALELHRVDGTVETKTLSRTQPLMIGKQPFNDICVPEEGVAAMHCRVLWNKTAFEVTAATAAGVEVNGTSVVHALLRAGDLIRVGSLDLIYADDTEQEESPEVDFQELPPAQNRATKAQPAPSQLSRPEPARVERPRPPSEPRPEKRPEPQPKPVEDLSLFEGPVYSESQALETYNSPPDSEPEYESRRHADRHGGSGKGGKPPQRTDRPTGGWKPQSRPGEQDIFRSPLVMGLSIGGLVLVLVAGIFWFLMGREQANRLYDRAVAELNDGQYAQSIASFDQFLQQYPGHSLQRQAERGRDRGQVQREISGAVPAWKRGLEQLQSLISTHRNESDFAELHSTINKFAEEIALGAARTAESARDADLLTVSEDAQVLLERFADPSSPPAAALGRIKEARVAAVIAIGKKKIFDDGMAAVDAALTAKQPMVALAEREKLVRAYDGFASQKRVQEALRKALDLERSVITAADVDRAAETDDPALPGRSPSLAIYLTRTRTDETSQGRVAYVLAKDCCYATDTVTGEVVWRRVTGFDLPFFPILVTGSQPGLLLYDAYNESLVCCQPHSGTLIWRQKLEGRPRSAPLVQEGQIYLPTSDRSLCRIDVETGRLTERVTFSQNLHGPPILAADGRHLLIPGEMAMIYSLSTRPMAAAATTFTDHAAGSLSAPPLGLGKLLLLCENDQSDSAKLRLWDAGNPSAPLTELSGKTIRLRGQVREAPVLRGNQLVVPSSGEHLAAFTVTDDAGRAGLVQIAQYRVNEETPKDKKLDADPDKEPDPPAEPPARKGPRIPFYLALGADQQFWGAGSAFRRFEIGPDFIRMDSNSAAPGIASQKLQLIGDQFFVARKALFNDSVTFSAIDRDKLLVPWRVVLGSKPLELVSSRTGGAIAINEAGQMTQLSSDRLRDGGIDLKSVVELPVPEGVAEPLMTATLHDGRIAVSAIGGNSTQIWIIGTAGQTEFHSGLGKKEVIQAPPVLLDRGLVCALPGRLKLLPVSSGSKSVQDWLAPAGQEPAAPWKYLVRLDADEVLACTATGLLLRIQTRATDVPHLAEAAKVQLDQALDLPPLLRGESLFVADSAGTAQQLNWRSFDVEGKRSFPAAVRGHWTAGNLWLIWSDGKLHAVAEGRDLPIRWSIDLKGQEPCGAPLVDGNTLWIACRNGTVLVIDSKNSDQVRRQQLPQTLAMGIQKLGEAFFAVSCDGALYRLESPQSDQKQD